MFTEAQQATIREALAIIASTYQREDLLANNAQVVRQFCQLHLAALEHEVFAVLFLDNQHRLISFDPMFRGTIDAASVYPREVAKAALLHNAAAVIFTHNHPSGTADPSQADMRLTDRLVQVLELLDVRVLDHIVVGATETHSFAQSGLL